MDQRTELAALRVAANKLLQACDVVPNGSLSAEFVRETFRDSLPEADALSPSAGGGWLSIDSAPKSVADGTRVEGIYLLGFEPDDELSPETTIDVIWWEPLLPNSAGTRGKWCRSASDTAVECKPTHWQPLPPPPIAAPRTGGG